MSYIDQITVGSTTYDIQDSTVPSWAKASAAPVLSVNNKTGVVSLSATDVGAYSKPSTGIPASDIASGVIPVAATAAPASLGTASAGSSPSWARGDHVHPKPTYSKSDVGLGNVDNVKQYSASNPPPYPVTSVNGSTGAVSINAVPAGGSEGQVLAKTSSGYGWVDMASTLTFTVENENLSILQI